MQITVNLTEFLCFIRSILRFSSNLESDMLSKITLKYHYLEKLEVCSNIILDFISIRLLLHKYFIIS